MESVNSWLESLLISHVIPDQRVAEQHRAVLDLRIRQMEELLPKSKEVLEGVRVELAGSVKSDTKVGESDEFDINVVVKLPFNVSQVSLNFDSSSPGYATLEVPQATVRELEDKFDIFAEDGETYHVSAYKLDQIVRKAVIMDLNNLNNESGSGTRELKQYIVFDLNMWTDTLAYPADEGWPSHSHNIAFKVDIVSCIQLPLANLTAHPTITKTIKNIKNIFPDIPIEDIVRLVPKMSPRFSQFCKLLNPQIPLNQ